LRALLTQGFQLYGDKSIRRIPQAEIENLDTTQPLFVTQDCLVRGRVIHGPFSGIELSIETVGARPVSFDWVEFPDKRFSDSPLNQQLAGLTVSVSTAHLTQRAQQLRVPDTVDVVYTWVDGDDPTWRNRRAKYAPETPTADAVAESRFESNQELKYSLRSLFRYFNGLGCVYVVTDAQTPDFLDEFGDRVILVDHTQIMDDRIATPTFNSHVIESVLHRIHGLSQTYLYFNDDFLIGAPVGPASFFDSDGLTKCFYSTRAFIPKGEPDENTLGVDAAAMNLRTILADKFDHHIEHKFQHTPVAMRRKVMQEIDEQFKAPLDVLRQNRFRSLTDLSPTSSLYPHYAVMTGMGIPAKIHYRYYNLNSEPMARKLFKLSIERDIQHPKVYCLNQSGLGILSARAIGQMNRYLCALYPTRMEMGFGANLTNRLFH
jgi:hypothetical protein